jgi:formamidopyrimidine-DNA glycosylase
MPELPEVQTVVNSLQPLIVGRRLQRVVHVRHDMIGPAQFDLPSALQNRVVNSIDRRGKRIVFTLSDANRFYIHLGMTGQLTVESQSTATRPHTHLIINIGRRQQLRFVDPRRFGQITWLGSLPADAGMGPEPLRLSAAKFHRQLTRTNRTIKTTLLDQRFVAGIGNIYADEALFMSRIHPQTIASSLTTMQAAQLNRAIKRVLKSAIRHHGSSLQDYVDANGERGSFQLRHNVYDRTGEPCKACKTLIVRIVLGQRSTHFCPACQKQ